jgi:hypothetical protein
VLNCVISLSPCPSTPTTQSPALAKAIWVPSGLSAGSLPLVIIKDCSEPSSFMMQMSRTPSPFQSAL